MGFHYRDYYTYKLEIECDLLLFSPRENFLAFLTSYLPLIEVAFNE